MKAAENPTPTSSVSRTLLLLAVGVASLSLIALFVTLVLYAMSVTPWPGLIAIGLYGLPVAFMFLIAYLLVSLRARRRSSATAAMER
ncbi:hypothetical protein [Neomicrococcus aestuarii]|uniref:ABC-type Na+ efflux pump permease subunit n=1 Tax=Neomicrococcus aestuarii TaxID=556325 RepID=A0A7W8WYH0_9MICC|nr:hypothetical protein [Neomicrococcus aestuarii]MBB5512316.1 ABC-type Na+ efflux pump permease subunit [Neomicrococcus aestuarii]